ncbi:MAG: helix-turn-helix transcriptional regulator [Clostridia bacterium]|nr:helix-turn-helix transcriptional regulator [Clostridia bacterium]
MIGERLEALRKGKKLSRAALGEMLGVSATAVYKWETNQTDPSMDKLNAIADLYGVSLDELCGRAAPQLKEIAVMSRAMRLMTPEERQDYLKVGRILYKKAFGEAEA